ncbi:thiamine pyrophosphate-dependent enzyme [Methanotrichaceae archaeon M04Ac]|uniref:Thiamine pyrophosphate-dependent enzyme n=1 Tax=Candidatus Methanocrinis alkalitolerans TaxID=3033395 RepID=A0ABT5XDL3_9EURY|nr:thiamine pyrophosphate-dependent enzyme [Candidatus Methanocrinis alkalitolerans]MCR3884009.1 thiamine pyrophosphate-dependent enzyme [Methanothrix sp.]MDF0592781.1 thiamine pyrophosphate-dependent enzyme [Candidatus Methanocrinis alkalitolerans]
MKPQDLATGAENTWCPGCGNFAILNAIKPVLADLDEEGLIPVENVVMVSGIGCHAKIADYVNANSFYAVHGRTIPVATGIKLANPDLTVICFAGDGDAYAEGLDHLIFAAKRNVDITTIIHDNRVYGLTTGQYTPTSPSGFKGRSTPSGLEVPPINPLEIVFASGGTFVGRGYSHGIDLLKDIFRSAILHRGFSFVDVLQVCVTFFNMYDYYNQRVYPLEDHDPLDRARAQEEMKEWDYNSDGPIPLGVFFKKDAATFGDNFKKFNSRKTDLEASIRKTLEGYI